MLKHKFKNLKVLKTNAFIKVSLGFNKYDLPIRLSKEYHKDELIKTITKSFGGGSNSSLQMTNIIEIDVLKIFLFNFDIQAIYVAKHTTTVILKIHHE